MWIQYAYSRILHHHPFALPVPAPIRRCRGLNNSWPTLLVRVPSKYTTPYPKSLFHVLRPLHDTPPNRDVPAAEVGKGVVSSLMEAMGSGLGFRVGSRFRVHRATWA